MPIPITYETADYQANETLKGFTDTDSLAKSYLELHGRVSGGSIDLLPEEMRKDPAIATFKTVAELGKGYVETKKMVGSIEKAPAKPEEYKFTTLQNVHPGIKVDGIQGALRTIAHEAGIGNKAADVVQQKIVSMLSTQAAQQEQARKDLAQKNETALRQEWGGEFDAKFDQIVKVWNAAGAKDEQVDVNEVSKALKGSPAFLKRLDKIVSMLSEDSIKNLGDGPTPEVGDAKAAQEAIQTMNAEIVAQGMKHPFYDEKHPDHGKVKEQMGKWFALAYPNAQ